MALDTNNSVLLPDTIDWVEGALIEPLAVGLHAVNMSTDIRGKRVLILGAGPVGLAVSFWCRFMGAYHITVTEPEQLRRESAMRFGERLSLSRQSIDDSRDGALTRTATHRARRSLLPALPSPALAV